jgi:hypothetical protein
MVSLGLLVLIEQGSYLEDSLALNLLTCMVKCPNCGAEVAKPVRALKNHAFTIEAYECSSCHTKFKVTH